MNTGAFGEDRAVNQVFCSLKLSQTFPLTCLVFQDFTLYLGRPNCM